LTREEIDRIQLEVPKLPRQYREEFAPLRVDSSVIMKVMAQRVYAELVSRVLIDGGVAAARRVANWIASSLTAGNEGAVLLPSAAGLVALADMAEKAEITSNAATELFNALMEGETNPKQLAEDRNLLQVSDEGAVAAIVDEVLADP